jgi:hypothetical protein
LWLSLRTRTFSFSPSARGGIGVGLEISPAFCVSMVLPGDEDGAIAVGIDGLNIDINMIVLFAGCRSVYDLFRRLLFPRMVFLLLFPFFFADLCMVNFIGFIYLILQFAPILTELNCEILLLHIRMLLLDLLDPLHDLRLENLSFNGADHVDPFTENPLYILISAR